MDIHKQLTTTIPQLARGQVWCRTCGTTQRVDSAQAMRSGWPKCCGYTMRLESTKEFIAAIEAGGIPHLSTGKEKA